MGARREMHMSDLTTEEGVVAHMEAATSDNDWNARAKAVKKANGGQYPDFWYPAMIQSKRMDKITAKWGSQFGSVPVVMTEAEMKAKFG
jgi:hypothetical protein